jgi:anti-sigma-K factor RskA/putative zinc finger protein
MTADIHTLVGAYVLDAVDDIERAAFDRHLRECDSCREEVDELGETAARLADGAWSVPPPRLRDNVLAEIANVRQIAPHSPAGPVEIKRWKGSTRWMRLAAVAAAVVAAVGTGTAVYTIQDHRVDKERTAALAAQASEARIRAILAAPDLVVRERTLDTGGRVTVAVSKLHNAGVIVMTATAPASQGRVYQLWTIRQGTAVPEGSMTVGQTATVQIVDGLPEASDVGVTAEPAPGATKPTMPLLADVKLI